MSAVRVYNSFEELPVIPESQFSSSHSLSSVFLTPAWFNNFSRNVADQGQFLRIYEWATSSGVTPGRVVLPMRSLKRPGPFAPRQLAGLANFYSGLFGPIISGTNVCAREGLSRVCDSILSEAPHWDVIDLHPLDKESQLFPFLLSKLSKANMAVQPYFCFGNWFLKVEGRSYQEYMNTLPSVLRNTLQRKSRQLAKAGSLSLRIVTELGEVEKAIKEYESVYTASWKINEPYPDFIPSLIRMSAERGWLRLGLAYIDGQVAAAQLWIVFNGVASIYKLAYDQRFTKTSIGSILTAHLMEHVIDVDKVSEVDFLCGDETYKRDWMSHRRERWGIAAYNLRTVRGFLAACRHIGGKALKRKLERLRT